MAKTSGTRDQRLVDRAPSTPLNELQVVAIDCQTTGATPARGHLLELAWAQTCAGASHAPVVESRLVRPADDAPIPRRIRRLTGLSADHMRDAVPLSRAWGDFCADLRDRDISHGVIHYARFERRFLEHAHQHTTPPVNTPHGDLPIDIICTHAIAQRLFADLPRRGLRALAGYLGHTLPEARRAPHHVAATVTIWKHVVARLARDYDVTTLADLRAWLREQAPTHRGGASYALPRDVRLALPDTPGVYRLLSKSGDILYVGKATSLKQRVNTYFQTRRGLSEAKLEMVTQVWDVAVTECGSALEAALMENDAIKRHAPPYNRALRIRQRELHWLSPDWRSASTSPDDHHRAGPIADPRRFRLLRALRDGSLDDVPPDILPFFGETTAMLSQGVQALEERFGIRLRRPGSALRRAALDLWRLRREREAQPDPEGEVDTDVHAPAWTPELVAERLASTLRWCLRELRLARWLDLLADAHIAWTSSTNQQRTLILTAGRPLDVPWPLAGALDEPGGRLRSLATRDRLRVLNTELRRLATPSSDLKVTLENQRILTSAKLQRLYDWI